MFACALLCGCGAGYVALPEQRPEPSGSDPASSPHFVSMSQPRADAHIVKDIAKGPGAGWRRWANAAPELTFDLDADRLWSAEAILAVPDEIRRQTGPVKISVRVNGQEAGVAVFDMGDERTITFPAPAGLSGKTRLEFVPDRVFVSPADGAKLSFLLRAAGFRER
jgi:hypothetical protein